MSNFLKKMSNFLKRMSNFLKKMSNFLLSQGSCGSAPAPVCYKNHWKGDKWCDDENNNEGCEWDGGDCCGPDVKTKYCSKCECLDPAWGPCKV